MYIKIDNAAERDRLKKIEDEYQAEVVIEKRALALQKKQELNKKWRTEGSIYRMEKLIKEHFELIIENCYLNFDDNQYEPEFAAVY